MTNLFLENFLFYWFMQKSTSAGLAYLRLLAWSCTCLWMAGTVRLVLLSVAHDTSLSFSPRPVPGSLSSLLHLHNRQRQPMPASMPGTLPNPTMPGSSAVLMPVSFLVVFLLLLFLFCGGRRLFFCSIQPLQSWEPAGFSKKSKCNGLRKPDLFLCFVSHNRCS